MKAVILNGSEHNQEVLQPAHQTIKNLLEISGWEVESFMARDLKLPACCGNFSCWIKTPGMCQFPGDNRKIAEAFIQSDLSIFLSRVVFGGYSAELKKIIDHLIQNISPFFTTYQGETHHQKRYKRYPSLAAVGYLPLPDEESQEIFKELFSRNVLNTYPPQHACCVIDGTMSEQNTHNEIHACLTEAGVKL